MSASYNWTGDHQITDNIFQDDRTVARHIVVDVSELGAGSVIDRNQWYAPNDMDGKALTDDTTPVSFAEWQGLGLDTNGNDSDPEFIDPANGEFDVPAGRVMFTVRPA